MNFTGVDFPPPSVDLMGNALDSEIISPSSFANALIWGPIAYVAIPPIYKVAKVGYEELKSWGQKAYDRLHQPHMNPLAKKVVEVTESCAKVGFNLLIEGAKISDEVFDVANFGGTKDPTASINKSLARIAQHNKDFAYCCDFVAEKMASLYLQKADKIKEKIKQAIQEYPYEDQKEEDLGWGGASFDPIEALQNAFFEKLANGSEWLLNVSQDLIVQTIKANVLQILANLGDEAFDPQKRFADQQRNPIGRLLTVVVSALAKYEKQLKDIEQSKDQDKETQYQQVFRELADELLAKCFPNGAEDLQLFHHTIPVKPFKKILWRKLTEALPSLLKKIYFETRSLSHEHSDWENMFAAEAYGLEVGHLLQLPSQLIGHFIRKDQGKLIDKLQPGIETWLIEKLRVSDLEAQNLSRLFVKYSKEFLITNEQILLKMGGFLERYGMERVLYNLSQFVPNIKDTETTPLPLYILQTWTEGKPLEMFWKALSKDPTVVSISKEAVQELLAPFGLNQEESFPLPASLKQHLWPVISHFIEDRLPKLMLQAIPEWTVLSQKTSHQSQIKLSFNDVSLINSLPHIAKRTVENAVSKLANSDFSLAEKLSVILPYPLTQDQKEKLDEQWDALLKQNKVLPLLMHKSEQCLEALALQLCADLIKNHSLSSLECAFSGLKHLFDGVIGDDQKDSPASFFVWFVQEIAKACEVLSIEALSEQDLENLKRAIHLKNEIQSAKDPSLVETEIEELKKLWPCIEPMFENFSSQLLSILGYDFQRKLPFPKGFRPHVEKFIYSILPKIIFNHASDFILPQIERAELEEKVQLLPEGDRIQKGCQFLAQDIIDHLPEWLNRKIDGAPNAFISLFPSLKLTDKAKDDLVTHLRGFVQQESSFDSIWRWLEGYIETLLLKLAVRVSQMSQNDLQKIQLLAQATRDRLLSLENQINGKDLALSEKDIEQEMGDEELLDPEKDVLSVDEAPQSSDKQILASFTDQLFAYLGIQDDKDLFGFPPALRKPMLANIKSKTTQFFLVLHRFDQKVRHHKVEINPVEVKLPTSRVAQAILSLTRFVIDKATLSLSIHADSDKKGMHSLYDPLSIWLGKQEKEYQTAKVFKEVIEEGIPTPFFSRVFKFLDDETLKSYKHQAADWINPVLTDQLIKALTPLLEKEGANREAFDQDLLIALLPILIRHVKHLNQASLQEGGLNFANFVRVAEDELHPAVPLEEEQHLKREMSFYTDQVDLIFRLIFPNGEKDLIKMLPDLDLKPDQISPIWNSAKHEIAGLLPKALDSLFNEEILLQLCKNFFDLSLKKLDKPIKLQKHKAKPLIEKEQEKQSLINRLVGEFAIEAARFVDIPIPIQKITRTGKLEEKVLESIGATVRIKFGGGLFVKCLQKSLATLADKEHVKASKKDKALLKAKTLNEIKVLEKKFAERALVFVFRYIGARVKHATDIFQNPALKVIRLATLVVCSFVMTRFVAGVLRLFKIEKFVGNCFYNLIKHAREKSFSVFVQTDLHEDLIYHGVEAFEDVIQSHLMPAS